MSTADLQGVISIESGAPLTRFNQSSDFSDLKRANGTPAHQFFCLARLRRVFEHLVFLKRVNDTPAISLFQFEIYNFCLIGRALHAFLSLDSTTRANGTPASAYRISEIR